ncbi:polysaccharide deacetylase family protein [Streptomyces phaeochromogenes]|uniref:polysaccharide deacetylase family protein n=1 Tax=Streptomyces phaeochromogenes TaxID=1923 RepID=UPI0037B3A667
MTRPPKRHGKRLRKPVFRAAVTLATGVSLFLTGGCGTLHGVKAPHDAREAAEESGARQSGGDSPDCTVAKCVALTFDGGPSEPTPKLLDILKEKKVHATFFLQGKGHTDTYPDTVLRMSREGHETANHTWSHKVLTELSAEEIEAEMKPVQDDVRSITGRAPVLMRPPQGRTGDDVSAVMRKLGLAQVLWSVTAKDYATTDTALITRRVLDQTRRDGIILLHDRYKGTVPAVPGIIDSLRRRGYTIVTVSQLLAPASPEPGTIYRP